MSTAFSIIPLSGDRLHAFFEYLHDHISDNGAHQQPLFLPIAREDLGLSQELRARFEEGLAADFNSRRWRRVLIALTEEGKIIGHCDLRSHPERYTNHRAIMGIGVHRAYRRIGLGRQLIEGIAKWAIEHTAVEYIDLWVISSNKAAVQLYEAIGFTPVGEVKDMYRIDGASIPYLQMMKRLRK